MVSRRGKYRIQTVAEMTGAPAEAARVVVRVDEGSNAPVDGDPFERACEAIVRAIVEFDPEELEQAVRGAMFLGSATTVYNRVLAPTMRTVGDRWHEGTFSIAQEHMTSEVLLGVARDLLRLLDPPSSAPEALLACFAHEEHALPLYGVAFGLVQAGLRPVLLGARTPPSAIRDAVEHLQPALVGLSVTVSPPTHHAQELIDGYAEAARSVLWIVGGAGAEPLRSHVEASSGIVVGTQTFDEVRPLVDKLLRTRTSLRD